MHNHVLTNAVGSRLSAVGRHGIQRVQAMSAENESSCASIRHAAVDDLRYVKVIYIQILTIVHSC
jgi:hypothetical protein